MDDGTQLTEGQLVRTPDGETVYKYLSDNADDEVLVENEDGEQTSIPREFLSPLEESGGVFSDLALYARPLPPDHFDDVFLQLPVLSAVQNDSPIASLWSTLQILYELEPSFIVENRENLLLVMQARYKNLLTPQTVAYNVDQFLKRHTKEKLGLPDRLLRGGIPKKDVQGLPYDLRKVLEGVMDGSIAPKEEDLRHSRIKKRRPKKRRSQYMNSTGFDFSSPLDGTAVSSSISLDLSPRHHLKVHSSGNFILNGRLVDERTTEELFSGHPLYEQALAYCFRLSQGMSSGRRDFFKTSNEQTLFEDAFRLSCARERAIAYSLRNRAGVSSAVKTDPTALKDYGPLGTILLKMDLPFDFEAQIELADFIDELMAQDPDISVEGLNYELNLAGFPMKEGWIRNLHNRLASIKDVYDLDPDDLDE